jgi:hypothetical protein
MKGFGLSRRAIVIVTLCGFGPPQAEAMEIVGGPSPVRDMNVGLVLKAYDERDKRHSGRRPDHHHEHHERHHEHRGPGPEPINPHPGPGPVNPQPGPGPVNPHPGPGPVNPQPGPGPVNPHPGPGPVQPRPVPPPANPPANPVQGGGVWARPAWYHWSPGGAVAAGAAIGFVTAASAAAWAGAPPQSGLCWYYTDSSRRQGFWDRCP